MNCLMGWRLVHCAGGCAGWTWMAGSSPAMTRDTAMTRYAGYAWLCALQSDVLVRGGVDEALDQAETGLRDARAYAADERKLPDRHVHRPFVEQLLHLGQQCGALAMVEFDRLLREQLIDL